MVAFTGVSIPIFWLGILLIIVFSVQLGRLPSSGMVTVGLPFSIADLLRHLLIPALVLSTFPLAQLTRLRAREHGRRAGPGLQEGPPRRPGLPET